MGGSRRKYKRSRTKVQVGLPKKYPGIYKPAFSLPPKLRASLREGEEDSSSSSKSKWDDKASVICNYKSFGFVSNPNFLTAHNRTSHTLQSHLLQSPPPHMPSVDDSDDDEDDSDDSHGDHKEMVKFAKEKIKFAELDDHGSDLEEDDLKTALSKKRKDGKSAPPQPLTTIQKIHIGKLVEKYGDNYQRMFMDVKLNKMQHSVATLEKLCKRYQMYKGRNPLILAS